MKNIKNMLLLFLTATIWGTAFVAQSVGMDHVGPFTFTFARSVIGGLFLIPCIWFLRRWSGKTEKVQVSKAEWLGGLCCGMALCAASNFQQIGIAYTTVGKAGFITALYVVMVPIFGLFLRKKVPGRIWFCVVLSVMGLYLLCMTEGSLKLAYGDFLVFICAILFTIHILIIDYFSPKGDGVVISCIQFFVCGIFSGVIMMFTEQVKMTDLLAAGGPILYAGVLSSGIAYTLQIVAQKDVNPTIASLILCLESVISALAGWLVLNETLTARELFGCALMFAAIILAQIPIKNKQD